MEVCSCYLDDELTRSKVRFNESFWTGFLKMAKMKLLARVNFYWFCVVQMCLSMTENVFDSCHKPGQVRLLEVS